MGTYFSDKMVGNKSLTYPIRHGTKQGKKVLWSPSVSVKPSETGVVH